MGSAEARNIRDPIHCRRSSRRASQPPERSSGSGSMRLTHGQINDSYGVISLTPLSPTRRRSALDAGCRPPRGWELVKSAVISNACSQMPTKRVRARVGLHYLRQRARGRKRRYGETRQEKGGTPRTGSARPGWVVLAAVAGPSAATLDALCGALRGQRPCNDTTSSARLGIIPHGMHGSVLSRRVRLILAVVSIAHLPRLIRLCNATFRSRYQCLSVR
jgi:hypothetical protein